MTIWICNTTEFTQPSMGTVKSEDASPAGVMVAEPQTRTKRPPFYKVVLLNDDYTPMEFVVQLLQAIFRKSQDEAVGIMLEVHQKGAGLCGVYTREVAETKVEQVIQFARRNEHPLQCVMEQE
jgi:ATP-dependent Clp protease adaptor protein ClpS